MIVAAVGKWIVAEQGMEGESDCGRWCAAEVGLVGRSLTENANQSLIHVSLRVVVGRCGGRRWEN